MKDKECIEKVSTILSKCDNNGCYELAKDLDENKKYSVDIELGSIKGGKINEGTWVDAVYWTTRGCGNNCYFKAQEVILS